jgi:hypothetical protein
VSVSPDLAAQVLVLCARHCCICRRFRPLHLQVHHIRLRSDGGPDEMDNLLAICVSCHADVHSDSRLTRRFSEIELRGHRETVYRMVADGRLPAHEVTKEAAEAICSRVLRAIVSYSGNSDLPRLAVELLLAAVCEEAPIHLSVQTNPDLYELTVGLRNFFLEREGDSPQPDVIEKLATEGLIRRSDSGWRATNKGMAFVDDLVSIADRRFTLIKVECRECSLHFIICSDYPERHCAATITCPECKQSGRFIVYQQKEFGHIFQHVPGHATMVEFIR